MKIDHVVVASPQGAATPVAGVGGEQAVGPFPAGLAAVVGDRQHAVRALLWQALQGRRPCERGEAGRPPRGVAGWVDVADASGSYRLRCGGDSGPVLVETLRGAAAEGRPHWQPVRDPAARVAAWIFFATADRHDDTQAMLSPDVARVVGGLGGTAASWRGASPTELLARRDRVAQQIEARLSERRRASEELEAVVTRLDDQAQRLVSRRETLRQGLHGVETELADVESRMRYRAINDEAQRSAAAREAADWRPRMDDVEAQIEHWRGTLADLEQRESTLLAQLAAAYPEDNQPGVPLADQRAGLAVARRLVEDLQSEVARLARASNDQAWACHDTHPRINPLVETLAQRLDRLIKITEQQEDALRAQSLAIEASHLKRTKEEVRHQVDHLLTRRQALWRTTRAKPEQTPESEARPATAEQRQALDARRNELRRDLAGVDNRLEEIAAERRAVVSRRSSAMKDQRLETLQTELNELQRRLDEPAEPPAPRTAPSGRASQWFAKLVDGRYAALRLIHGGRRLVAIDKHGREQSAESLTPADRRMAAFGLRLALAGGLSGRGVSMPLVLDEPTEGLAPRESAILATVLDDFCRQGHQGVVFTKDEAVLNRLRSLGCPILDLAAPGAEATPAPTPPRYVFASPAQTAGGPTAADPAAVDPAPAEPPKKTPAAPARKRGPTARVVREKVASEYLLHPEDPIDRFPVPIPDRAAAFARSRVRTIGDLLSADPSALAEELDRPDVSAALAALWQTHTAMVCFVPGMTFPAASMLTAAGVLGPDDLAAAEADELDRRVAGLLSSDRGERHEQNRWSHQMGQRWIAAARRGGARWRDSDAFRAWQRHGEERRQRVSENARGRLPQAVADRGLRVRTPAGDHPAEGSLPEPLEFRLETDNPVVEAPSIGPKTASKLRFAGVRTVGDLLAADPAEAAAALGPRMTPETVVAWQHQALLVCRVPMLRTRDARVLVACGFCQPEEVAAMKPAELLDFVLPFCQTPEGERLLRGGKAPDLETVTSWITWARRSRALAAA